MQIVFRNIEVLVPCHQNQSQNMWANNLFGFQSSAISSLIQVQYYIFVSATLQSIREYHLIQLVILMS